MTLRHMKIFVSVFQHSNITRAAEELHLAQPSVSFAVKELEDYYGIRLFDRIGRRISPTEAGRDFMNTRFILSRFSMKWRKRSGTGIRWGQSASEQALRSGIIFCLRCCGSTRKISEPES